MSDNFTNNPSVQVLMLKGAPGTTDFNELENKPTKLSEFANDGVFITNTSDDLVNYYTKTEDNALLDNKVDKETGKGLSTEDYTSEEKTKLSNIEEEANKTDVEIYSSTLTSSGWSSSAPYTQTVNISGILATDTPIADVVLDVVTSTAMTQISAWMCVSKIETANGSITATCLEEKPTINIPIQLKVVR